jgi:hypothetical protein
VKPAASAPVPVLGSRRAAAPACLRTQTVIVPVAVDAATLDLLMHLGWLDAEHCADRQRIGAAIAALLASTSSS